MAIGNTEETPPVSLVRGLLLLQRFQTDQSADLGPGFKYTSVVTRYVSQISVVCVCEKSTSDFGYANRINVRTLLTLYAEAISANHKHVIDTTLQNEEDPVSRRHGLNDLDVAATVLYRVYPN